MLHSLRVTHVRSTDLSSKLSARRQKRKRARENAFLLPSRRPISSGAKKRVRRGDADASFNYGEDVDYLQHQSMPKFLRGSSIRHPVVLANSHGSDQGGRKDHITVGVDAEGELGHSDNITDKNVVHVDGDEHSVVFERTEESGTTPHQATTRQRDHYSRRKRVNNI